LTTKRLGGKSLLLYTVAIIAVTSIAAVLLTLSLSEGKTDAPPSSQIQVYATIEQRPLAQTIVKTQSVDSKPLARIATFPSSDEATVVTRATHTTGDVVAEGDVLVEVSARPVIVLMGDTPSYRTMRFGDTGPDIGQMQESLARLGFPVSGDPAGEFRSGTASAIASLYRSRGYEVTPPTDDELTALASATDAVRTAASAKQAARASQDLPGFEASSRQLTQAQSTLAQLQAVTGPSVPLGEVAFVDDKGPLQVREDTALVGVSAASGSAHIDLVGATQFVPLDLTADEAARLTVGMTTTVELSTGAQIDGQLVTIASPQSVTPAASSDGTPQAESTGDAGPTWGVYVPSGQVTVASSVVVTVTVSSTPGDVFVVPSSALVDFADGSTSVTLRQDGSEESRNVRVRVGLVSGGFAQIDAVDGTLKAGDEVAVN
jgi:HlyD family secretion protein